MLPAIVEAQDAQLTTNAELARLRLVLASQSGELTLRKHNIQVIGGPANGPDTVRITIDLDVPLAQAN